jgi:hypothetical protein
VSAGKDSKGRSRAGDAVAISIAGTASTATMSFT